MRNMLLKDPERMTELFALLHKDQSALYQEKELNEAINNALLLEAEEHSIIASGRYSIEDVLYGRFYWYTKFLCRYEAIYGKNGSMEQAKALVEAYEETGIFDEGLYAFLDGKITLEDYYVGE